MIAKVLVLVAIGWLVVLPPFFTDGACTREFNREAVRMQQDEEATRTPELAGTYWEGRGVRYTVLSAEQCRKTKPRWLSSCGSGALVYGRVPVENMVCRAYRDSEILAKRQYDERGRLVRMQADMAPFKSLPIMGSTIYWGR